MKLNKVIIFVLAFGAGLFVQQTKAVLKEGRETIPRVNKLKVRPGEHGAGTRHLLGEDGAGIRHEDRRLLGEEGAGIWLGEDAEHNNDDLDEALLVEAEEEISEPDEVEFHEVELAD